MTGFGTVFRLAWRRNWLFHLIWLVVLAALLPATVSQYDSLIPQGEEGRAALLLLSADPTMRAILGPPHELGNAYGFSAWRVGGFVAWAAAMMAGLGVIRATRAEEEEGRTELIRSGAVGRHAPLAAAISLGLLANATLGVIAAASMVALGAPVPGSVALGAAIALGGSMFTGVGAVMAQVFESARNARYWTLGVVLGGLFLLRAFVDSSSVGNDVPAALSVLPWLNPLSWGGLVRPYADERWWVLLLPLALTAATVLLAFRLEAVRDHGAGLRPARLGRPTASSSLSGAWGLAWRLHRGGILGWTIGLSVSGVVIGTLAARMTDFIEGNEGFAEMLRRLGRGSADVTEGFYVGMSGFLVPLVALAAVGVLGRLRSEEAAGRAEAMLATATSRTTLAGSHLVLCLAVGFGLTVATTALMPVAGALRGGGWSMVGSMALAGLAMLPGTGLVIGLAMFVLGWFPRAWSVVLVLLGWSFIASFLAPVLQLPDWVQDLHPWGPLSHLPVDQFLWTPTLLVAAAALVLLVAGLAGYHQRDIHGR